MLQQRTLDIRVVMIERLRNGNRNGHPTIESELLGSAKNLRPFDEHEGWVERLHPELARELDIRPREGAPVVRVTPRDEEVALRRQRDAGMIYAGDTRIRHALIAEPFSEGCRRGVEFWHEHSVVCIGATNSIGNNRDACEARPGAVGYEDLAVRQMDEFM